MNDTLKCLGAPESLQAYEGVDENDNAPKLAELGIELAAVNAMQTKLVETLAQMEQERQLIRSPPAAAALEIKLTQLSHEIMRLEEQINLSQTMTDSTLNPRKSPSRTEQHRGGGLSDAGSPRLKSSGMPPGQTSLLSGANSQVSCRTPTGGADATACKIRLDLRGEIFEKLNDSDRQAASANVHPICVFQERDGCGFRRSLWCYEADSPRVLFKHDISRMTLKQFETKSKVNGQVNVRWTLGNRTYHIDFVDWSVRPGEVLMSVLKALRSEGVSFCDGKPSPFNPNAAATRPLNPYPGTGSGSADSKEREPTPGDRLSTICALRPPAPAETTDKPASAVSPLVDAKTGEENEDVKFCERAILYHYDSEAVQWKVRAVGEMKILCNRTTGKYAVSMRSVQTLTVCVNHRIIPGLKLSPRKDIKAYAWVTPSSADGGQGNERFAVRFRTKEEAEKFKEIFEQGSANSSNGRASYETQTAKVDAPVCKIRLDLRGIVYEKLSKSNEFFVAVAFVHPVCVFEEPNGGGFRRSLWCYRADSPRVLFKHDLSRMTLQTFETKGAQANVRWTSGDRAYHIDFVDWSVRPGEILMSVLEASRSGRVSFCDDKLSCGETNTVATGPLRSNALNSAPGPLVDQVSSIYAPRLPAETTDDPVIAFPLLSGTKTGKGDEDVKFCEKASPYDFETSRWRPRDHQTIPGLKLVPRGDFRGFAWDVSRPVDGKQWEQRSAVEFYGKEQSEKLQQMFEEGSARNSTSVEPQASKAEAPPKATQCKPSFPLSELFKPASRSSGAAAVSSPSNAETQNSEL